MPGRSPTASACEPYLDFIELSLSKGRNAKAIYQDLVDDHGFTGRYQSVKRFVRQLRGRPAPQACAVIVTPPGEEAQVDYGTGPMVRDPHSGRYRRTRMFVLTLGYSRKAVRLLTFHSSTRIWAELHEQAFRRLGGATRTVVLDNLGEGVLKPDIYDPALNPLYRDLLAHYGAVALPCRVARSGSQRQGGAQRRTRQEHAAQRPALREPRRGPGLPRPLGSSTGPTRASTAPPSARWRPCSPKRSRRCCRCPSSPSATTSSATAG